MVASIFSATRGTPTPTPRLRIVPVDTNTFYVVTSASDGVRAVKFIRNSGGNSGTDAGSQQPDWRVTGVARLASFASDPASPLFVWSLDAGAQDFVAQCTASGNFMGSYHGLGATGSLVSQTLTMDGVAFDPTTTAATGNTFVLTNSTQAVFGTSTFNRVLETTINAAGGVHFRIVGTPTGANLNTTTAAYIGMGIATGSAYDETHAQVAANGTWWPLSGDTGEARHYLAATKGVRLRDSASGRMVTMTGAMPSVTGFRQGETYRQTATTRMKSYFAFTSLANLAGVEWDLDCSEGAAGASSFGTTLITNGTFATDIAGWESVSTGTFGIPLWQSPGYLRNTRLAAQECRTRTTAPITVATNDYVFCKADQVAVSAGNPGTLRVANSNGLSATGAMVNQNMQTGTNGFLFLATQAALSPGLILAAGTVGQTCDYDNVLMTNKGAA